MSINERLEQYKELRKELEVSLPEDALNGALGAIALIKSRIQRTGIDADGEPFAPYTPEYAERGRVALGYQDEYVDLTRTGKFFESITAIIEQTAQRSVTVSIGPRGKRSENIAAGQLKKRGQVIKLSVNERQLVLDQFRNSRVARVNQKLR